MESWVSAKISNYNESDNSYDLKVMEASKFNLNPEADR
eukprot:UN13294